MNEPADMTPAADQPDDFETTSWHDNYIYGLSISIGDFEAGDWRSDLIFDIDHIVEWVPVKTGGMQFRVAPATLVFHNVTDLKLAVDWGDSGFRTALHEVSVDHIERTRITDQKICLDRPYYHWRIVLNWPSGGVISFGATSYTQTLRSAAVLQDEQKLSAATRRLYTGMYPVRPG